MRFRGDPASMRGSIAPVVTRSPMTGSSTPKACDA
jgi:hypothetical protein